MSAALTLVSALAVLAATACSGGGGGGGSPTEPPPPAPDLYVLQISWEYEVDAVTESGTSYPTAGHTIVLLNRQGGTPWSCSQDGVVWVDCICFEGENGIYDCIYQPENLRYIAECRTTPEGEVQAYYHDALSHINLGTLGPLVSSGCSRAEEWDSYAECCLVDS